MSNHSSALPIEVAMTCLAKLFSPAIADVIVVESVISCLSDRRSATGLLTQPLPACGERPDGIEDDIRCGVQVQLLTPIVRLPLTPPPPRKNGERSAPSALL